jgi:hypothetical protein
VVPAGIVLLGMVDSRRSPQGLVTLDARGKNCSTELNDILNIGGHAGWAAGRWMRLGRLGVQSSKRGRRTADGVPNLSQR